MQSSYSVRELNAHIRQMFERDDALQDIWVEGEISGFKQAPSGHYYFAMKDGKVLIDCAMWRSSAQQQPILPRDGDAVLAHGYVAIYEERSKYQFYVDRIRPLGVGDLYRQFELLKQKLAAEGLFDEERKRPLPLYPRKIGVVTSPNAAAFQDVLNVLRRRFPLVEVILSPTLVQGADAPTQIVRALDRLSHRDDIDVIWVGRGGGSIEDLWAFNDEAVARAIVASRVPVISGVGHETDFTIADFAADQRAPTPSAAAELLTPDISELQLGLSRLTRDLADTFEYSLQNRRSGLADQNRVLRQLSPLVRVRSYRQRLDDWQTRMTSIQRGRLSLLRERIESCEKALIASSPQAILERGYALVTTRDTGARVKSAHHAEGDVTLQFYDGTVQAKVDSHD